MIRTSTVRDLLATGAGLGIAALTAIVWATRSIHPGIDLAVYLRVGQAVLAGENPYSTEFGAGLPTPLPFTYPPIAAIAVAPLSFAPFWLVFSAWTVVSVGALSWLVQITFGSFLDLRGYQWFLLGLWAGLVTPVADSLALGQVSGILVPLVFFAALGVVVRGRSGPAVGVFTAIKLTPGLFILWFAFLRRWRAVVVNLSLVALLTGLGLALLPSSTWAYFSSEILEVERIGNPGSYMNQSLNGAFMRLGLSQAIWMVAATIVAVLGLTAATVLVRRNCAMGAISLVGLTSLLVSPVSW
ncbi:MAG: glycosyltransferase 87 family protein [Patescibacteria group bacterium]|nr:glycosyltransferase 87 family protein [Patescibacteria group bacterium]